jgi:hypothetical protein
MTYTGCSILILLKSCLQTCMTYTGCSILILLNSCLQTAMTYTGCSILILLKSCLQTCMTYTTAVCTVKNSWRWAEELSETCRVPSWSCSKAVYKPVWHIPLLCVQWKTPDDGQRDCPKHVEFHPDPAQKLSTNLYDIYRMFYPDPARKLSTNLYDIYHCCVYSEKLLMMGKGIVRNM